MEPSETIEGTDVVIPLSFVKQVNERLMMNAKGFFFFKFNTNEGLKQLLEDGPWTIRNVPIILKEWAPSVMVEKEDIKVILVWVKLHEVPLEAFTEDGLSLIASRIGTPKMLDSYTATMCAESWGRSSFARALIEVKAECELKKEVTIAIPNMDGNGHSKVPIRVEYDWEPLRCATCCVFGHNDSACPKNLKHEPSKEKPFKSEEFKEVPVKSSKGNNQGILIKNQKQKFIYRPVNKNKPKTNDKEATNHVKTSNPFDVLKDDETPTMNANAGGVRSQNVDPNGKSRNQEELVSDDIEIDDLLANIPTCLDRNNELNVSEGASTPGGLGSHG
ncbi:uncharacterized protein LOC110893467 [Helianthus annuus]|uniref:uncharacterized protein LOC110893467 n=1 Tax=Helianthus annuus TaxID=4232 RepID=UPI000B8F2652|nr:uncharacterized protein LOC110893467 [Helianthus annuus]